MAIGFSTYEPDILLEVCGSDGCEHPVSISRDALDANTWKNLQAQLGLRDSAIHFYCRSTVFAQRLQQIGAAGVVNFTASASDWFKRVLCELDFHLMTLSFIVFPNEARPEVEHPHVVGCDGPCHPP
jgi:hypothetical protein